MNQTQNPTPHVVPPSGGSRAFNWREVTPEQRNSACARFLPPSDTNPLRSWHLYLADEEKGQIGVETEERALIWMDAVRSSRETWEKYVPDIPWDCAPMVKIKEHTRHIRYTDTPAGAWMLIEELTKRGYVVSISVTDETCAIGAEKTAAILSSRELTERKLFVGSEPFPELAGMLWLTLNGMEVKQ